ncbi:BON domain-containing protein [Uliginosibacterium aquaticum]|uniref:BON domain-containing protein n=1 Tax=Uliginosibacterium aquaticum TaxID=2731212 RepID=A0ABX2IFS9_9RHOO|nr:BON domain-containing protein [Uliginosibacterium aquaticum]NSL55072.1 BON domain-containing protein [Uliginosibacterium aquaticum]
MKNDSQIREDVIAELKWEPSICADSIGVMVEDGVFTLAGPVESYAEKSQAEHAALGVGSCRSSPGI